MGSLGEINRVSNGLDDRIINCLYQRQPFGQPITVPFVLQYLANKSLSPLFACLSSPRVFIKHHNNTWPEFPRTCQTDWFTCQEYVHYHLVYSKYFFPQYLYIFFFSVRLAIRRNFNRNCKNRRMEIASCMLFVFLSFLLFFDFHGSFIIDRKKVSNGSSIEKQREFKIDVKALYFSAKKERLSISFLYLIIFLKIV